MNIQKDIVIVTVKDEHGNVVLEQPCHNWSEATAKARIYAAVINPELVSFHVEPVN